MDCLSKSTVLKYYKRKEIQEALVQHAFNREIGTRFQDSFGKRPDVLTYPREVLELALRGLTSFHASEERWSNPLNLHSNLSRRELDELREGWDLVLDIDCKFLEYSKICANLIVQFLAYCGVQDISVKFSGNKGFHIGVPFEAFPAKIGDVPTARLFPEAARKIAFYVKENIKEQLGQQILALEKNNFAAVKEKVGLDDNALIRYENIKGDQIAKLNVDGFLEIDTVLISSRHLYRMAYSLHEKSGLVSLPIDAQSILFFEKKMALPEVVVPQLLFLQPPQQGESARRLLIQAMDFEVNTREAPLVKKDFEEMIITSPIGVEYFPPCMKLALQGMGDGKKRVSFALMNFLGKIGWSNEEINAFLHEWNQKNPQPLRENYIQGQMAHFKAGEKLPPNCDNEAYYLGVGICKPDGLCKRIKNPANYTLLRWKRHLRDLEEEKEGKKEKKDIVGQKGTEGKH